MSNSLDGGARTIALRAVVAIVSQVGSRESPWVNDSSIIFEVRVRVALPLKFVFLADFVVLVRLHELVEAGVEDLSEARAFLGESESGAVDSVLEHARVDVGKLGTEAAPYVAVPFVDAGRVVAFVLVGHVSVDPNSVDVFREQHGESNVVGVFEGEVFGEVTTVVLVARLVGCRRAFHGPAIELLAGAVVKDESESVSGGSPASDIDNFDPIQIAGGGNRRRAVAVETHQKTSGLVDVEDSVRKFQESVALPSSVRVGHAAVEVASGETRADRARVPALLPLGLHGHDFEVANFVHALDDVDDDAGELIVTLGRATKVGEGRVVDVLG